MSTHLEPVTDTPTGQVNKRIVSIDIFRGLTMAVMIFVNALPENAGLPWWTYHAHAAEDRMTYVDMVFPFFLFIIGLSLPLSIAQRLKKNASLPALWMHVILRFLGLLVLGLVLANADKADRARMGMGGNLWGLLAVVSVALYLNVYGKSEQFPAYSRVLRILGLVGVVILFAVFRRTTSDGRVAWIDFSYPEILGLIAYTYLVVMLLYIPTRRRRWAAWIWFVALVGFNALSSARLIGWLANLPWYLWPPNNGSMACIVMAGVIVCGIFMTVEGRPAARHPIPIAVGFGLTALAAARLLTPLGISKIRATPTWSLYSIGAAALMFTLLYWICDVKLKTGWAFLLKPAGSNTLLTYLLPDVWYFLSGVLGFTLLDTHFASGWPAVVKTFFFAFAILAIAGVLTRWRLRLQL